MTTQQATELVVVFLKKNPESTKAAISDATEVKGIVLTNVFKKLAGEGSLMEAEGDEGKLYSLTEQPASGSADGEGEETEITSKRGRDTKKYKFKPFGSNETLEYGKGRLVLAVIRSYVDENKPTLKQLLDVFGSTDLLKRFAPVAEISVARERSGARDRYLFNDIDQIKLKDKNIVAVSNQWTSDSIQPILLKFKSLGYRVK